jgi:hypothetical protein
MPTAPDRRDLPGAVHLAKARKVVRVLLYGMQGRLHIHRVLHMIFN